MNHPERTHKKTQTHKQKSLGFKCVECKHIIPMANVHIGTEHRDHCPFCLYSLHVDREKPGDRQSSCNSKMKPIGLTFKFNSSELMIVYQCLGCGKWYKNRCAGDDSSEALIQIFKDSIDTHPQKSPIVIPLATKSDAQTVFEGIFGKGFIPHYLRTEFNL